MRAVLSWIGGRVVLFLLLMLAIGLFQSGLMSSAWDRIGSVEGDLGPWASTAEVAAQLDASATQARADLDTSLREFEDWSGAQRRQALTRRRQRLAAVRSLLAQEKGMFDDYRPDRIAARYRLTLEETALASEIAVLEAHVDLDTLNARDAATLPRIASIERARNACDAANESIRDFNARPYAEKWVLNRTHDESTVLTRTAKARCDRADALIANRREALRRASDTRAKLANARQELDARRTAAETSFDRIATPETGTMLVDIAKQAAMALLAIMAMPYLIRTLLYYGLAPLAARRAAIRIPALAKGGGGATIPLPGPSRVSLSVRPSEVEELLVRQSYLQTSSTAGAKSTRWLLDYRHPLSSIASGLVFLTRIRGAGEATTISATRSGFDEMTALELPMGTACVLHPRALVAVVQPIGQPISIRSHWRLFSLNAWLTMQLRYLSFHGPGQLIVKGGRGVRVERAEQGRVFAQDQLVGFSADLAYSVTRTETFAPYLFGREPLLKDTVQAGSGLLVIEEAPLSMRGGSIRRGLEGMVDAGMKVFGL